MARALLSQIRRRLVLQGLFETLAVAFALWAFLLLPCALVLRGAAFWQGALALGALALTAGVAFALARRPTLAAVAARIDRAAGTRDRLATAWELEQAGARTPLERAAAAECETFLAGLDFKPVTPWRFPRGLVWAAGPLIAVALLRLWGPPPGGAQERAARANDPAAAQTAATLESMARQLETQPGQERAAELAKLAEALRRSAERLREEKEGDSAPGAAALRELSALEERLRAETAAAALGALADALSGPAPEAAAAMKRGDAQEGAKGLEALAREMREGRLEAARAEALAQALAKAAKGVGKTSPLGAAAERASAAAGKGDREGAAKALGEMGQALRESRQGAGDAQTQRLIAALREMKSPGDAGGEKSQETGGAGGQGGKVAVFDASQKPGNEAAQGPATSAGGQPGSERDEGAKNSPLGASAAPPAEEGAPVSLEGLLGQGETLRSLVPAAPGEEPARTGYKALYDAAAPAAEDALEREEIPPGARRMVRRYFEAIRPAR